jgi:DtxR family Mn-dependent transcriptional regulator
MARPKRKSGPGALGVRQRRARPLTASQEDYLEAILACVRESRVARVRDIARRLGVAMSSVTAALKALSERKLVDYEAYQFVTLTDRGRELAEAVRRRHDVLREFLIEVLRLDEERAEANACRMEHAVDERVLSGLAELNEFLHDCPRAGEAWLARFGQGCRHGANDELCGPCVDEAKRRTETPDERSV